MKNAVVIVLFCLAWQAEPVLAQLKPGEPLLAAEKQALQEALDDGVADASPAGVPTLCRKQHLQIVGVAFESAL
jgi:hypothetical protein